MSTTAIVKQAKSIEETLMDRQSIERFKAGIGELERFLTAEKLARVALTAVLQNSDLLECDPRTILAATLQLGQVGLLPDGFLGQAYLIPFENTVGYDHGKPVKQMQATPMIGYRGFGELIARSGKANSHDAQVVYSEDVFDFAMGSDPYIRHVRKLGKRGDPVGAYAIVYMKEGPARFDIMDIEELAKIRKNARGASSPKSPWTTWTEEMYRKSPVRRLAKYVPLSSEFQRASTIDEGSELGYSKFDEKRGEYVLEAHNGKEEKAPVQQPQRVQNGGPIIVGERVATTTGPVCSACNAPVKMDGDNVVHVDEREYDHRATTVTPETKAPEAEQETANTQPVEGTAGLFSEEKPAAQSATEEQPRELTYEMTEPDQYDKVKNPGGKHISEAQVKRLYAILHAAQEKAKTGGSKALSDDELKAHCQKLGYQDTRFIPKADKAIYDGICEFAGGAGLGVKNGGK